MTLRNNTWKLNESYDQDVAGNSDYVFPVEMWACGQNGFGFLGEGSTPTNQQRSSPIQIPGSWQAISTGMAIKQTGTTESSLFCWGYGGNGQNAQSNVVSYSSPTQVPGTNWRKLVNSWQFRGAIKNDGTLWMWGNNTYGRLGINVPTNSHRSSPTQVGTDNNWHYVSAADDSAMGLKTDGTLWAWGSNGVGQLGQNDRSSRLSPTQIPGTTWNSISCWRYGGSATKTDGTAWTWGYNEYGQLMQNDLVHRSSPVQVPGTDWANAYPYNNTGISVGNSINQQQVLMQKTNGSIWYCGNPDGEMGMNAKYNSPTPSRRSSPTELGAGTAWAEFTRDFVQSYMTRYGSNIVGVKSNGTLWVTGKNSEGEAGQNNMSVSNYSSPIQIPGTWSTEKASSGGGYNNVFAKDP